MALIHKALHPSEPVVCGDKIPKDELRCETCRVAFWQGLSDTPNNEPVTDIDVTLGSWFKVKTIDEMSNFYMSRLPFIRSAARDHGYAIGLHGSTRRDFDLIAVPWGDIYSNKDVLAKAIQNAACGITNNSFVWEEKPNGRSATAFPICWTEFHYSFGEPRMISGGHIDLSVMENIPLIADAELQEAIDWIIVKLSGDDVARNSILNSKYLADILTSANSLSTENQALRKELAEKKGICI